MEWDTPPQDLWPRCVPMGIDGSTKMSASSLHRYWSSCRTFLNVVRSHASVSKGLSTVFACETALWLPLGPDGTCTWAHQLDKQLMHVRSDHTDHTHVLDNAPLQPFVNCSPHSLMQAFGYCWGVQRAVEMAYEARKQYPGQKLHITNGETLVLPPEEHRVVDLVCKHQAS